MMENKKPLKTKAKVKAKEVKPKALVKKPSDSIKQVWQKLITNEQKKNDTLRDHYKMKYKQVESPTNSMGNSLRSSIITSKHY